MRGTKNKTAEQKRLPKGRAKIFHSLAI
jgi:hypothetical protein